jgi:hypothetical protein
VTVQQAIAAAERILPGRAARRGHKDPRWQAIIEVSEFIRTHPQRVWAFTLRWGSHKNADLQAAIATCLLEHLLEHHFNNYLPKVTKAVRADSVFAKTFSICSKFGQSRKPANSRRFDKLQAYALDSASKRGPHRGRF